MAEDLQLDVVEAQNILAQATRPRIKSAIENIIKNFNQQIETLPKAVVSSEPANIIKTYVEVSTCGFDQEDGNVLLFWELANIGNVPKNQINVRFNDNSVIAIVEGLGGKNYRFSLGPLFQNIVPSASTYKVRKNQIVFYLRKENPNNNWDNLKKPEEKFKPKPEKKPGYDANDPGIRF
jgi:hypothetical protein